MPRLLRAAALAALILAPACRGAGSRPADTTVAVASQVAAAGDVATPHAAMTAHAPAATGDSVVTVYKSPTCGCCRNWVDHMKAQGFAVVTIDTADLAAVKHSHGIAGDLGSCHTATVGGYVLEGHVPAADVRRLLAERPAVVGLAVPGMPMGSPGMEGPVKQAYDVIAFDRTGGRTVFASH